MSATSSIQLHAFCDAHWARCKDTTKNIVISNNIKISGNSEVVTNIRILASTFVSRPNKRLLVTTFRSTLVIVANVRNKINISVE